MPLDAPDIAAAFGLGRPLGALRPLGNGGHPSATGVLTTERGRWVVKTGRLIDDWQRHQAVRVHRLKCPRYEEYTSVPPGTATGRRAGQRTTSASGVAGRPVSRGTQSATPASSPAAIAVYVETQASSCQSGAPYEARVRYASATDCGR